MAMGRSSLVCEHLALRIGTHPQVFLNENMMIHSDMKRSTPETGDNEKTLCYPGVTIIACTCNILVLPKL
jgi:hypothetical protein